MLWTDTPARRATGLVVGLPVAATLPGNLAIAAWFASTAWLLGRAEVRQQPALAPSPA